MKEILTVNFNATINQKLISRLYGCMEMIFKGGYLLDLDKGKIIVYKK